jgi:methylase of polypeptide subunit release factors
LELGSIEVCPLFLCRLAYSDSHCRKRLSALLSPDLQQRLLQTGVLEHSDEDSEAAGSSGGALLRSTVRVSNLYLPTLVRPLQSQSHSPYYFHSSFPTTAADSVFFGPDTYLFLDFMSVELPKLTLQGASSAGSPSAALRPRYAVDVCCGSGAGAIHLARHYNSDNSSSSPVSVVGLDMNDAALDLAHVNATLAGCASSITFTSSDLFAAVAHRSDVDLIVTNPPYIATSAQDGPKYSDGGGQQGLGLPLRIVKEGLDVLAPGGYLLMYTGVAVAYKQPGRDALLEHLKELETQGDVKLVGYRVLMPDMFGEELSNAAYEDIGRIQLVGAVLRKLK